MAWKPQAACESSLSWERRVYRPSEGAHLMILGKNQQTCGNYWRSLSHCALWEPSSCLVQRHWPCVPTLLVAVGCEWSWLFVVELTPLLASYLCSNCECGAISKATFPNLIFFTYWINFWVLQEFLLLPKMEAPLSAFALNVSAVWHGLGVAFLLAGKKKSVLISTQLAWTVWRQKHSQRQFWHYFFSVSTFYLSTSSYYSIFHVKLYSAVSMTSLFWLSFFLLIMLGFFEAWVFSLNPPHRAVWDFSL